MKIKVISRSGRLPAYQTEGSAGFDIQAWLPEGPMIIRAGERALVPTGYFVELPPGYEAQVRARSGIAVKNGVGLVNGVGTVDPDYRGEWRVPMINWSSEDFTINDGDRIAQVVISRFERVEFENADEIAETERGGGGFGHTGI